MTVDASPTSAVRPVRHVRDGGGERAEEGVVRCCKTHYDEVAHSCPGRPEGWSLSWTSS